MDPAAAADLLRRLQAAQQAFYDGGSDVGLREVLTADIGWHVPGSNAIAGHYCGFEAVVEYFAARRALAGGTLRLHLRELLVGDGTHLAALTDGTATLAGTEHRWSTIGLYRTETGRVAECWLLPLDPPGFDRIWTFPR